jgi:hypothetical protein
MFKVKLLIAVVMVVVIFVVGWRSYVAGQDEATMRISAAWTQERLLTQQEINNQLVNARVREKTLTDLLATLKQEHNREIQRINIKHKSIVDSLRNRPDTRASDSGVPLGAAAGVGCTGAGLAKPDAAFLAGYATDAAKLNEALQVCRKAYNEIRRELNKE